jgi:hypothetical protein
VRHSLRRYAVPGLLSLLSACSAKLLDVGSGTPTPAPAAPDPDSGGEAQAPGLPLGLYVDDVACTSQPTSASREWPTWAVGGRGECAVIGPVTFVVASEASIAYPQSCSVATSVLAMIGHDPDGSITYLHFVANVSTGACVIASGPSLTGPATPLAFTATVIDSRDPRRSHRISYRAGGPGPQPGDSGSDAPQNPPLTRPAPVACPTVERPPGDFLGATGGECANDGECDDRTTGRCDLKNGTAACSYHLCMRDEDCTGNVACGCGVGWAGQNLCLGSSNCRVNTDCPSGQVCAFSDPPILRFGDRITQGNEIEQGINYTGDALGYFCTTPSDDCNCPRAGSTDRCIYNANRMSWGCAYAP